MTANHTTVRDAMGHRVNMARMGFLETSSGGGPACYGASFNQPNFGGIGVIPYWEPGPPPKDFWPAPHTPWDPSNHLNFSTESPKPSWEQIRDAVAVHFGKQLDNDQLYRVIEHLRGYLAEDKGEVKP